ncbi:glyoxalase [Modestobacter muralis]|uniref:Glyoxalase n=1 Tax=Modestobacter muralis TaxID=1608614 RepID=A0A6P0EUP2_9ACTN|nr:VOC family protein [Modestobacter muralis]NEK94209.1 glyoxalase [Modestobacter muralis]NEN50977.1 glyoxalase [Modestobacter muralis]
MTTPAHPRRTFFVTLPVVDVARSRAFFAALGFTFDEAFSGEGAACMLIGEQANVMLGDHATFAQHSKLPMADPTTHALALYSFSVPAREDVDRVVDTALAAGAVEADPLEDLGFMVSRSFFDLDGHGWQVMWMASATAGQDVEPAAQVAGV